MTKISAFLVLTLLVFGMSVWATEPMADADAIALWTQLRSALPLEGMRVETVADGFYLSYRVMTGDTLTEASRFYQLVAKSIRPNGTAWYQLLFEQQCGTYFCVVTVDPSAGTVQELAAPVETGLDGPMGPFAYYRYSISSL